ncbi:MAG: hypothetical protein M0O99_02710 [Desulfuromonas thiophila]|nr:hypothetical protein [Desulfuromonas thiophila]
MKLLSHDVDTLNEVFPQAATFIRAAHLREEAFSLLCQRHNSFLSDWQKQRLEELLAAPACQESWFLAITASMTREA